MDDGDGDCEVEGFVAMGKVEYVCYEGRVGLMASGDVD